MNNKIVILIIAFYCVAVLLIIGEGLYPGFISEGTIIPSLLGEVDYDGVKITIPKDYRVIKSDNIVVLIPWNESFYEASNNDRILIKKYDHKIDKDLFKNAKTVKIGNHKAKMRILTKGNEFGYGIYLLNYHGKKYVIYPSAEDKSKISDNSFKKHQKLNQKIIAEIFNI